MPDKVARKVKRGEITTCCFDCADKHRDKPMYDGTYSMWIGTCQVCKKDKQVTSAMKAFGFHKFL